MFDSDLCVGGYRRNADGPTLIIIGCRFQNMSLSSAELEPGGIWAGQVTIAAHDCAAPPGMWEKTPLILAGDHQFALTMLVTAEPGYVSGSPRITLHVDAEGNFS